MTDYVYAFESFVLKHINAALRGKKLPAGVWDRTELRWLTVHFTGVDHRICSTPVRPVSASKTALESS